MTTALVPHPEFYCGDGDWLRDRVNRVPLTRIEARAAVVHLADRLFSDGHDTLARILYLTARASCAAHANELLGAVLEFERHAGLCQERLLFEEVA